MGDEGLDEREEGLAVEQQEEQQIVGVLDVDVPERERQLHRDLVLHHNLLGVLPVRRVRQSVSIHHVSYTAHTARARIAHTAHTAQACRRVPAVLDEGGHPFEDLLHAGGARPAAHRLGKVGPAVELDLQQIHDFWCTPPRCEISILHTGQRVRASGGAGCAYWRAES